MMRLADKAGLKDSVISIPLFLVEVVLLLINTAAGLAFCLWNSLLEVSPSAVVYMDG